MIDASAISARDHAMLLVLVDAGCRVSALASMQRDSVEVERQNGSWEDFDLSDIPPNCPNTYRGRIVVIEQKTAQYRTVYFGSRAVVALAVYLRSRADLDPCLWRSTRGSAMTPNGIYQAFKRIGKRAGVEVFNPHAFRHALAQRLHDNGASIAVISNILGHSDTRITADMYLGFDTDELANLHEKFNKR